MDFNFLGAFDEILNGKSKTSVIYDPSKVTGIDLMSKISRFEIPGAKMYEPYNLNYQNISAMDSKITFLPQDLNLGVFGFENASTFYYRRGGENKTHIFWTPKAFSELLHKKQQNHISSSDYKNYDITLLGIFALLIRYHYEDPIFKSFVENKYLKPNFEYNTKHRLWILNEENRNKLNIEHDFIIRLIDFHENHGIEYLNGNIPYTFAWRKHLE